MQGLSSPLNEIKHGFGYIIIRSPYAPYSSAGGPYVRIMENGSYHLGCKVSQNVRYLLGSYWGPSLSWETISYCSRNYIYRRVVFRASGGSSIAGAHIPGSQVGPGYHPDRCLPETLRSVPPTHPFAFFAGSALISCTFG